MPPRQPPGCRCYLPKGLPFAPYFFTFSLFHLILVDVSYQVIARKWRPQVFDEVTGQEIVTRTLRNAIEHDRLHHAYLFSGARGVGKTTTARILAKALNCHKADKPTVTPCKWDAPDICSSCQEIAESRSIDVLEIDAASHTGIDDVRETIIESISFNPARDRYKVFIIDEVHQLSKPAFNALLKTLEEPPENVVFIMATTELHKVPDTILSRCQEFQFRTIPLQKIFERLKLIAEAEGIKITDDALRELARSGEGSMRDAQSNFDQVISFSGEEIGVTDVTGALGFAGSQVLANVIAAIRENDPKAILSIVDELIAGGHDLRNFCRDLLGLIRDLLVFKVAGGDTKLFETAVFSGEQMGGMAADLSESDLLRFFNSLCETEAALREAAHPRYVLEMGLVKLVEMRRLASIETVLARLEQFANGNVAANSTASAAAHERASIAPKPAPVTEKKKTLKPEINLPQPEIEPQQGLSAADALNSSFEDLIEEPPDDDIGYAEPSLNDPEPAGILGSIRDLADRAEMPASKYLPPLPVEIREHIEDPRLDAAYELKLSWTGDDLLPIRGLDELVDKLIGVERALPGIVSGGNGSAAAPAVDLASIAPHLAERDEPVEIPVLGEEPTEQELVAYAQALPAVRAAMRVFRARVVDVKKV